MKQKVTKNRDDCHSNDPNISPVNGALLFSYYSLEIRQLEEMIMEIVQVKNADQQEGGGDENPGEQHGHGELLQAQVLQAEAEDRHIWRKTQKKLSSQTNCLSLNEVQSSQI